MPLLSYLRPWATDPESRARAPRRPNRREFRSSFDDAQLESRQMLSGVCAFDHSEAADTSSLPKPLVSIETDKEFSRAEDGHILGTETIDLGSNFTFSTWAKPSELKGAHDIVSMGQYFTIIAVEDGDIQAGLGSGGRMEIFVQSPVDQIKIGDLIHVATTYDDEVFRLFLNGKQVAEGAHADLSLKGEINLGIRELDSGQKIYPFVGTIPDVDAYNSTLTTEDIEKLYLAGPSAGGSSSEKKESSSDNKESGDIPSPVLTVIPDIQFSRAEDAHILNAGEVDLGSSFTFTAWAKPSELKGAHDVVSIGQKFTMIMVEDGDVQAGLGSGGARMEAFVQSPVDKLTVGKDHHLAIRYDGTTFRLFLDGVKVAEKAEAGLNLGGNINIGIRELDNGQKIYPFVGNIAHVGVYDSALSDENLQVLYEQGVEGALDSTKPLESTERLELLCSVTDEIQDGVVFSEKVKEDNSFGLPWPGGSFANVHRLEEYIEKMERIRKHLKNTLPNPLLVDLSETEALARYRNPDLFSDDQEITDEIIEGRSFQISLANSDIRSHDSNVRRVMEMEVVMAKRRSGELVGDPNELEGIMNTSKQMRLREFEGVGNGFFLGGKYSVTYQDVKRTYLEQQQMWNAIDTAVDARIAAGRALDVHDYPEGTDIPDALDDFIKGLPEDLQRIFESLNQEERESLSIALQSSDYLASLSPGEEGSVRLAVDGSNLLVSAARDALITSTLLSQEDYRTPIGVGLEEIDGKIDIRWRVDDEKQFDRLDLFLIGWADGSPKGGLVIQKELPGQGRFVWDGLSELKPGRYQIIVSGVHGSTRKIGGSQRFTVGTPMEYMTHKEKVSFVLARTDMPVDGKGWTHTIGSNAHKRYSYSKPDGSIVKVDHTHALDLNLNSPKYNSDDGMAVYPTYRGVIDEIVPKLGLIVLKHEEDGVVWYTEYMHVDIADNLKQGALIDTNDLMGEISDVAATNEHLHFVISLLDDATKQRNSINPYAWLEDNGITVIIDPGNSPIAFARWDKERSAWIDINDDERIWDLSSQSWK